MTTDTIIELYRHWRRKHGLRLGPDLQMQKLVEEVGELHRAQYRLQSCNPTAQQQEELDTLRVDALGDIFFAWLGVAIECGYEPEGIIGKTWREIEARSTIRVRS